MFVCCPYNNLRSEFTQKKEWLAYPRQGPLIIMLFTRSSTRQQWTLVYCILNYSLAVNHQSGPHQWQRLRGLKLKGLRKQPGSQDTLVKIQFQWNAVRFYLLWWWNSLLASYFLDSLLVVASYRYSAQSIISTITSNKWFKNKIKLSLLLKERPTFTYSLPIIPLWSLFFFDQQICQ